MALVSGRKNATTPLATCSPRGVSSPFALRQLLRKFACILGAGLVFAVLSEGAAGNVVAEELDRAYSPPLRVPAKRHLFWGDLHLHTNLSADAYINGTQTLGQEDAYRFAMGQRVVVANGTAVALAAPLDFLAVTDHGENLGLYSRIQQADPLFEGRPIASQYQEVLRLFSQGLGLRESFMAVIQKYGPMPRMSDEAKSRIWDDVARVADFYNKPGTFSTLIGYEWTSMVTGDNLHRVVLYKDGAEQVAQFLPSDATLNPDPESLWRDLAEYEDQTGGSVIAIAHNGNLSNGRMFSHERVNGKKLDAAYSRLRQRWEPLYEVTQIKGDGETHPALSPGDDFADFETWDSSNVAGTALKQDWMLRHEYARSALLDGLLFESSLGVNPFKFGMIGGTDSHTGLSTTEENNFFGKFKGSNPSPSRLGGRVAGEFQSNQKLAASGLTGVWAEQNTREAIFDALSRREVYATTGSRIKVRVFGGWDFEPEDIHRPDYARLGYQNGVPMGGHLTRDPHAVAPTFLIHAARDPEGAFLDRIQVVKGWVDGTGNRYERIYDVAMAGDREPNEDGKIAAVGNTVDVDSAEYRNSIGVSELATWWRDPDFIASQQAFYYVRVLEIPTPRWTTYDAAHFGVSTSNTTPDTVQDRAYSSPIWYRP